MTKSRAIELGEDRIRVNAILPGLVAGDRQRQVLEAKSRHRRVFFQDAKAEAFRFALIKEFVPPEAIADQILSRASPVGRFLSGQAIPVCGDLKMLP